jgi:prepilin-type N-terminal cleavage/methylation domain-containing protein
MMKSQKGFTLPELIVAVAITGLIVSFFGTAVYQTLTVTEYGSDKMIATHELQNAAHWVSLDGQMAKAASGGSELVLTLPNDSIITYSVENRELHRTTAESEMTLARNISDVYFDFSVEDRVITMTITSSPEGRPNVSEQGTYKVCLRVEEE